MKTRNEITKGLEDLLKNEADKALECWLNGNLGGFKDSATKIFDIIKDAEDKIKQDLYNELDLIPR